MKQSLIGQPAHRKEGRDKVTGQARYVDDLTFPDMLHGVTVRSPIARADSCAAFSSAKASPGTNSPLSLPKTFPVQTASR